MATLRKFLVTAAAAAVSAALLGTAIAQQAAPQKPDTAQAQPSPRGFGFGPGIMMGPGMMGGRFGRDYRAMCNPRAAGFAEWRIDRIERAVNPNEAQKKALDDLRAASSKAAEQIASACPAEFPANPVDRLAVMEKRMETMLQAMKTVRPAFEAFYATLSDEQKLRLERAGPRRWGWHRWG